MKSTQVIKCKQCSKLSLGRELPNEGRRHRTICSQRRTHYTHEKKKANSVSEHCWDVREVEAYFTFLCVFFCRCGFLLRQQILDLLQPMIGRAKSPQKIAPFGSLVFGVENGRNTYS